MVELIKFWKYFLVSSILIFIISCDSSTNSLVEKELVVISEELTREDSIKILAKELNIDFDENLDNVNIILNKILITKRSLIHKLDSLDNRADQMENLAYEFKKKEDKLEKEKLLSEIMKIKKELERIKSLSGTDEILKKDETSIAEVKIPFKTETFEDLPAGNYTTRIDKYHLLSIYVKKNGDVIIGQPKLDSITIIKGSRKINPRLKKEIEQIKNKLEENFE